MNSIKARMKKIYKSEYMPFLVFGVVIFIMISRVALLGGDDLFFKQELTENNLMTWLYKRYHTWSGRMSIELVLGLFNFNLPLWKIINTGMSMALMIAISNYSTALIQDKKIRRNINIILCCCFFMFYPYVITSSVIWYTGSFYYLWTTVAFLVALIPFYYAMIGRMQVYKISTVIYFVATAYACYMEQQLAIILCFGMIVLIYLKISHKRIPKILWMQYIFALGNIIFYFSAPGTKVRSGVELHWYPDFEMLTLIDKVFQGINWTNQHIIKGSDILFLMLTTVIAVLYYKKHSDNSKVKFLGSIPMIFSLLQIIPFNSLMSRVSNYQHGNTANLYQEIENSYRTFDIENTLDNIFFNANIANPSNLNTGVMSLLPAIFSLAIVLFIGILIFVILEQQETKVCISLLYFGGLAAGYILAFSPTIFASGSRVFFIIDTINLMIIGVLLKELSNWINLKDGKNIKRFIYVLLFFGFIVIMTYLQSFIHHYPWL